MTGIAEEAGVARSTVFNHFGSKHALLYGIAERIWALYRDALEQAIEDRATPTPHLIRGLFERIGQEVESSRQLYRSVFREMFKPTLGLDEGGSAQASRQAAKDRLFQLIERGQRRGELSSNHRPVDLIIAFRSLIDGTITYWLYDDCSEPLSERMIRTANIFLSSVATIDIEPSVDPPSKLNGDLTLQSSPAETVSGTF